MPSKAIFMACAFLVACSSSEPEVTKRDKQALQAKDTALGKKDSELEGADDDLAEEVKKLKADLAAVKKDLDSANGSWTDAIMATAADVQTLFTDADQADLRTSDLETRVAQIEARLVALESQVTAATEALVSVTESTPKRLWLYDGDKVRRYETTTFGPGYAYALIQPNVIAGFKINNPVSNGISGTQGTIFYTEPGCTGEAFAPNSPDMNYLYYSQYAGFGYVVTSWVAGPVSHASTIDSVVGCVNSTGGYAGPGYKIGFTVPTSKFLFPPPVTVGP